MKSTQSRQAAPIEVATGMDQRSNLARALSAIRRCWRLARFDEVITRCESLMRDDHNGIGACDAPRLQAIRLAARSAMALGDAERAAQWCRRGLAICCNDVTLLTTMSRCELIDDRKLSALCLSEKAIVRGGGRAEVMEHAARARAAIGDADGAVGALEQAVRIDPRSARRRIEQARAALACDRCEVGLRAIETLCDPPALLMARLLRGTGRLRDAADIFRAIISTGAVHGACCSISPNAQSWLALRSAHYETDAVGSAMNELIGVLEELGEVQQLKTLAQCWLDDPGADVRIGLRLAEAMLGIGSPGRCVRLARRAGKHPSTAQRALMLITAAATVARRGRLADLAFSQVNTQDRRYNARIWRRGATAEIITQQYSARAAGADPSTSILEPMLRNAQSTLDRLVTDHPGYADLHYHHAHVLAALGSNDPALVEVERALTINPGYEKARRLKQVLAAA